MLQCFLVYAAILADPVSLVQIRYPAHRISFITSSGINVVYTVASDAPPELKRAYKVLEIAEREVVITEALQMFRVEIVANERRLEALRTARIAAYLTDTRSNNRMMFFDPNVHAPIESRLKLRLSDSLAADAKVERALQALDRLVEAHYLLQQTLFAIAYPDRRPSAAAKPPAPPQIVQAPVPAASGSVADAERAEKVAADAEQFAEEREREAKVKERAADAKYRDAEPADRAAARAAWLKARDAWEQARRDWDAARDQWQAARDQLYVLQKAQRATATNPTRPVLVPVAPPR